MTGPVTPGSGAAPVVAATPRLASTIVLLRDAASGPEVWLQERSRAVGFMPSAWVFPGGRVDPEDDDGGVSPDDRVPRVFWTAGVRELAEEANVVLVVDDLRPYARWITPAAEPRRFDTLFFVARVPEGVEPRIDGVEASRGGWFGIPDALARIESGTLPASPPTLRTLWELREATTVQAVLDAPRRIIPCCPAYHIEPDGTHFVLLPGDPDHPSSDAVDPPHRYAFHQGRWWAGN